MESFRDISGRVKLEEAALVHESLISDVFASVQEGMFIVDRDYTILKTNPAFEAMYPEHMPLVGKKCYATSLLDHVCDGCPVAEMFATGKTVMSVHHELPTDTKPGMWLEHYAHPIFSPSRNVLAAVCIIRDVTQRKENEETLQRYRDQLEEMVRVRTHDLERSDANIRAILSGGSVPILFASPDGTVTFVNTAAQVLTGYSEQEWLGETPWSKIYDEQTRSDDRFVQQRADLYAEKCDQIRQEILIRRKNGESRWIDLTVSMVRDPEGNQSQIIIVLLDITERFQMVQAIEEAHTQARLMLDSTPLACSFMEKNRTIDCNMEAVRLFELSSKQEFCERFFELSPEYQADGRRSLNVIRNHLLQVRKTGWTRFEWMHQKLDGTPIPCEITIVRVKRKDADTYVSYARDIRERKRHEAAQEQELQRTNALLELAQMTAQPEPDIINFTIKSVISLTDSGAGYVALLEHANRVQPFHSFISDEKFHCSLPTMTSGRTPHLLSAMLTECLETKKAAIQNDFASLPGTRTFPQGHFPLHSHMCVPIMDGETPIGILGVGNKAAPYTKADTRHLTLLAQGLSNLLNRKKYAEYLEKARKE
ncbi:MAG: PAS domain S-box protein, partial [Planctomycetaceae bacterium]|nr:PAS domain S-box protein [Planctomycetaceae bacterium]